MHVVLLTSDARWFRDIHVSLQRWVDVEHVVIPLWPIPRSKWSAIVVRLWMEVRYTPTIMRLLFVRDRPTILLCSTYQLAALLAAKLARYCGVQARVYLFNFYLFGQAYDYHRLSEKRIVRLALRYLLTQDVGLFLTSPNEAPYYRQLSPGARIKFYPYAGVDVSCVPHGAVQLGDFIFAGGYTNRDYSLVLQAARRLQDAEFVLVCSSSNRLPSRLPPNVQVRRDVDWVTFHTLMAGSRCVLVPLKADVGSSGQMVALAAMQLGKLTVFADYPPIAQYFSDGEDGLAYRPGDLNDLCAKLDRCLRDPTGVLQMGARSRRKYVRYFSQASFYARIVDDFMVFAGIEH